MGNEQEVTGMEMTNIMLVDDERRLCDSTSYLLKSKGYNVVTANCGREATSILKGRSFDLAILDLHLPDMLGTEIMSQIKIHSPDTVVIMITGEADIDSALAALKFGAYDYLRKPFEFEEMLKTIEHALEQKRLKQEKDKINEQLIISEKKYRYLVRNSPDIIYTLDSNGNFSFISKAVEQLLGFTAIDLIGKHYSTIVYEEDRDKAKWHFDERRSIHRTSVGMELRLKVNDNSIHDRASKNSLTVELKSMGIYEGSHADNKNEYIGTHGVIRDISERCNLQAQLHRAERLESIGTLAGGIAHDFNNLLMGLQGRSTLISMDLNKPDKINEHLIAIDDYIHSATELTRQLLGFARGVKYEVKPTDVIELLFKSANMFGRTKKEITIDTHFHKSPVVVEGDPGQIEQVFLNLYVNAWQAMPQGGALRIETNECVMDEEACSAFHVKPGQYLKISVADTGFGMSQNVMQQIFDPFFTTKEKSRGTGLGLASAYGIIKNHGGFINVTSEIGVGSTFFIYLPISQKETRKKISEKRTLNNGSETILLVDDEQMIIDVGKSLLENLGYRVIAVTSGEKAINAIRFNGYGIDLVLLDMIMPDMDGGQAFDHIRKIHPDMPVMLSSGYAMNGLAQEIMNKGCNGFIQKPFTLSEISHKIRQILESKKMSMKLMDMG